MSGNLEERGVEAESEDPGSVGDGEVVVGGAECVSFIIPYAGKRVGCWIRGGGVLTCDGMGQR